MFHLYCHSLKSSAPSPGHGGLVILMLENGSGTVTSGFHLDLSTPYFKVSYLHRRTVWLCKWFPIESPTAMLFGLHSENFQEKVRGDEHLLLAFHSIKFGLPSNETESWRVADFSSTDLALTPTYSFALSKLEFARVSEQHQWISNVMDYCLSSSGASYEKSLGFCYTSRSSKPMVSTFSGLVKIEVFYRQLKKKWIWLFVITIYIKLSMFIILLLHSPVIPGVKWQ